MNFWEITLDLLGGFGISCLLFVLTLLLAIPLGLCFSFCSMSKHAFIKTPSKVFIWVIRGIPLMLFIFIIYYLPGLLSGGGEAANIFHTLDLEITVAMGKTDLTISYEPNEVKVADKWIFLFWPLFFLGVLIGAISAMFKEDEK